MLKNIHDTFRYSYLRCVISVSIILPQCKIVTNFGRGSVILGGFSRLHQRMQDLNLATFLALNILNMLYGILNDSIYYVIFFFNIAKKKIFAILKQLLSSFRPNKNKINLLCFL